MLPILLNSQILSGLIKQELTTGQALVHKLPQKLLQSGLHWFQKWKIQCSFSPSPILGGLPSKSYMLSHKKQQLKSSKYSYIQYYHEYMKDLMAPKGCVYVH